MKARFANFRERLEGGAPNEGDPASPVAPNTTPEPTGPGDEPGDNDHNKEDDDVSDNNTPLEEREDYKAGMTAGRAAAEARMNAVFAHENTKGREAAAIKLLGKASMSSEDIVDVLADMPVAAVASQEEANRVATEAAEAAARDEMQKGMKAAGNKDLGADHRNEPKSARAVADGVWDKANAAVGRVKKEG